MQRRSGIVGVLLLFLSTLAATVGNPARTEGILKPNAGSDRIPSQNLPLGRTLLLDGTASPAAENQKLAYHWFGPFGRVNGATPLVTLPIGESAVSLIVSDGDASSRASTASISVRSCFDLNVETRARELQVQLNWSNRLHAERYDIYRSMGESPTSFIKIGESARSNFRDTTVFPNASFLYVVDAYNQGVSCYSEVRSVHIGHGTKPENHAPLIYSTPVTTATVDIPYRYDVNATDPDRSDWLRYFLDTAPQGMSIDRLTGLIRWTPKEPGVYSVIVRVRDSTRRQQDSATQKFKITVIRFSLNRKPTANAGLDQSVFVTETARLDGSASTDPDGDPLSYTWTINSKPNGSQAQLSDPTAVKPSLVIDKPGAYEIRLAVRDGELASDPDFVTISTLNSQPVANAGLDQTVTAGATVQLDASGSIDTDQASAGDSVTITAEAPPVVDITTRTTTRPGGWPILAFDIDVIAGIDNNLGMPIFIPPLDTGNFQLVGGTQDVTLHMAGIEGLELKVFANSATFIGGARTGLMGLSQVSNDQVPMPPIGGAAPPWTWTLQPAGAILDPPAQLTAPNARGFPPEQIVDIVSFDHDLGQFISVGTVTVQPDDRVRSGQRFAPSGLGLSGASAGADYRWASAATSSASSTLPRRAPPKS